MGHPVTEAQANEILIRTDSWYELYTNDRVWEAWVLDQARVIMGRPQYETTLWGHDNTIERAHAQLDALRDWHSDAGIIPLEYLGNRRIVSNSFCGPHGWCNWDGKIFTSEYNIGKWPTVDCVETEWTRIAEAFPFLRLRAQLINEVPESAGDDYYADSAAVEFLVEHGSVTVIENPPEMLKLPQRTTEEVANTFFANMTSGSRNYERGVSAQRLQAAMRHVAQIRGLGGEHDGL